MSLLSDILQYKQQEREREVADINAIGTSVSNFINLRQQAQDQELNRRFMEAKIKSLEPSELDNLLQRGKAAEAARSLGNESLFNQITGKARAINIDLDPAAQISQPATDLIDSVMQKNELEKFNIQGQQPSEFEAQSLERDDFGNLIPADFKRKQPTAAQEKRNVETNELAGQTKNLLGLFNKARAEAESVEGFGESGVKGRVANLTAVAKGKLGSSPAVNVFQDRIGAFATIAAKSAGEQRPTDEDIKRFSKSLTNLKNSDEENALQMEMTLKDIQAKGQSISWAEPFVKEFEKTTGKKVDFSFGVKLPENIADLKEEDISKLSDEELRQLAGEK